MAEASLHALVSGRVQGVGFRWHTHARARELGLRGWVANLADGRVEVYAEGEASDLDALVAWLHRGPGAARVEKVDVDRGPSPAFLAREYARIAW